MEIEESNVAKVINYLSRMFRSGDKWVAYNDYRSPVDSGNLTTFRQITSASAYCENNTGDNYGASEFRYFTFQPIINAIKALTGADATVKTGTDMNRLNEQIQQHCVTDTPHNYKKPLVDLLSDGLYHPVGVKQQILPWKDMESYQVIEHFYPKGMIYEVGHSHRSHGDFGSYYEAQKCFEQLMDKYKEDRDAPELKLIGKIKGQDLALDLEDFPQPGTGVLFKMANHVFGESGQRNYVAEQKTELDKPVDMVLHKMAKYNLRTAVLEFFDGSLQKVAPGAKVPFMNFGSLSKKPVEILSSVKKTLSGDEQLSHDQEKRQNQRLKP